MFLRRLLYAVAGLAVLAVAFVLIARAMLASDLVRSALEQQLSAWLDEPVRIGEARASVVPRITLDLRDVTIGDPPAVTLGEVRVVTGLRGVLARRVVDAEVVVADSRLELPLPFAILAAAPRVAEADPPSGPAFTIESVSAIGFRNITVIGNGRELVIDMDSSFDGDRLEVAALTVRAPTTRIEARGELTSIERVQGRFDATAAPLDIAEMIAIGSALSTPAGGGAAGGGNPEAATVHLVVALTAPVAQFDAWEVRDVAATMDITPGQVRASPLSLGVAGGTAAGALDVDTAAPAPRLRLTGRMADVRLEELTGPEGAPRGITGQLGGDVSLTGAGTDIDALRASAKGTVRAVVTDGMIPGMDMVRTIVLAFGRPDGAPPEGSGSAFSRLGGTFALAAGTLRTDDFAMESRDFDLSGRATLDLASRAIDATVDVVLSQDLTAQAGTDLRRYAQEDGRIIIPARITGTLDRAIVALDLEAVVKRAIGTELRRRVRSVLDDILRPRNDR
jgi:hypothetical protein